MARAVRIVLSAAERSDLERLRRRKIARADAMRAEIVLLAANGYGNSAIARTVGVTRKTAQSWRSRFAKRRLDGLDDEPRCGAPRKIGDDRIEEIVTRTLEAKPADATHWSTREMANASGVSASSVHRIWRAFCLQPYRVACRVESLETLVQRDWTPRVAHVIPLDHEGQTLGSTV